MSKQTTSPTGGIGYTLGHLFLDSHLTVKNFFGFALMAAVPILVVTSA